LMVPGSLSSALHTTYFSSPGAFRTASHFTPVGKPAPPRPLRPAAFNRAITPSQSRVSINVRSAPYGGASLNSDLQFDFNDQVAAQYDLYNVRYVVAPRGLALPSFLQVLRSTTRYVLYAAPSSTYFDVTQGNNYVPDSGNGSGQYSAASGYDLTTGLGTPHAPQLVEAVCNSKAGPAGAKYTPVAPSRLLDTRSTGQTLHAGSTLPLQVAGQGGVPASGATAVVLNVTATNTTGNSFLTVFPDGQPRPISSNLNYTSGVTVPNLVTVQLPANGKIDFYNNLANVDVVVDVFGYYSADGASGYKPAGPSRLLDTRNAGPSIGDHGTRLLQVTGQQGIPATGVTAAILNVTATNPTANSFISVYPGGTPVPASSNLNFGPGQTIANLVTVPVGSDGTVSFFNHVGNVDVVVDVFGYYTNDGTGLGFHATAPARLADSRTGSGLIGNNGTPVGQGGVAQVAIQNVNGMAGNNGLLGTAGALALNVTATNPTANSFISVYGSSLPVPASSNLNFTPGLTIPNSVVVPTNGGAINLFNHVGNVDVVVDLFGYFS